MTTNKDLFAKHAHLKHFVETGTCYGRSVELALALGFENIRSVEAQRARFIECCAKFRGNRKVQLWNGESVATLPDMLAGLQEPVLLWLDAHPSGAGSFGQDYETNVDHEQSHVLRAELRIIKQRNVKGDVILIDDLTIDVMTFAMELFKGCGITIHDTDEGVAKVMEIQT